MIAVLIQVPLVDGKPDLALPDGVEVVREGRYAHVSWGEHALSLMYIGKPSGQASVFVGMMSAGVAIRLAHLGAKVKRLRDAWLAPAVRTWLMARGVAEVDGLPVPPHVIAGGGEDIGP